MSDPADIRAQFEKEGRVWLRGALSDTDLVELSGLASSTDRPGQRVSEKDPLFDYVRQASFNARIAEIWPGMVPVRIVTFDKRPTMNWGVPWHQDRVIAVDRRLDIEGYSNWSKKAEAWHCEPPVSVLREMLFVRVHLDASTEENGSMEIAPGSHREGLVPAEQAKDVALRYGAEPTIAEPGDVLVLAMLTLHRSPSGTSDEPRRALRIDYSPSALPEPLGWAI